MGDIKVKKFGDWPASFPIGEWGVRYRVIGKSREDGEKDLERLTQTAEQENSWLFIEGRNAEGKPAAVWYSIGTPVGHFRVERLKDDVVAAIEDFRSLGFVPDRATDYHYHPCRKFPWTRNVFEMCDVASSDDFYSAHIHSIWSGQLNINSADTRVIVPRGIWKFESPYSPREMSMQFPKVQPSVARDAASKYEQWHLKCTAFTNPVADFFTRIPFVGIFFSGRFCSPEEFVRLFSYEYMTISFTLSAPAESK